MAKDEFKGLSPVKVANYLIDKVNKRSDTPEITDLFKNQFMGKFSINDCKAYIRLFEEQIEKEKGKVVSKHVAALKEVGFEFTKEQLEAIEKKD